MSVTHYGNLDDALAFSAEALQSLRPTMNEALLLDTLLRSVEGWVRCPRVSPLTLSNIALQIGLCFFDYEDFDAFRTWMDLAEGLKHKASPSHQQRVINFRIRQHRLFADYKRAESTEEFFRVRDELRRLRDTWEDEIGRAIPEAPAVIQQHELLRLLDLNMTSEASNKLDSVKSFWKIDADGLKWEDDVNNLNPASITQWLLVGLRMIEAEIARQQDRPDWKDRVLDAARVGKRRKIRKAWTTQLDALRAVANTCGSASEVGELVVKPCLPLGLKNACARIGRELQAVLITS